jgi:hypothetical protein
MNTTIAAIRPDGPKPPIQGSEAVEELCRPITVLDAGRRHPHREAPAEGIEQERPLASLDLGARVIAADPLVR